jgi:hypothetical protein
MNTFSVYNMSDHVDNLLGCLSSPGSPSVWGGIHARRIIISLFRYESPRVSNSKLTFGQSDRDTEEGEKRKDVSHSVCKIG